MSVLKNKGQKLIQGVAYNSKGIHKTKANGKSTVAYKKWYSMIQRCYSVSFQVKSPSYKDCMVCDEWLDFQNFAEWFYSQVDNDKDYHLDKDLLDPNNKKYSPNTCCLVPRDLNNLILDSKGIRGKHPQGVCFERKEGKFRACFKAGKRTNVFLGYFDCPQEAHQTYVKAKEAHVKKVANEWRGRIDKRVYEALMNWSVSK